MNAITSNPDAIVQPRRILVAAGLRDSRYLLPIAIIQAKATSAHLTLVHAVTYPAKSFVTGLVMRNLCSTHCCAPNEGTAYDGKETMMQSGA